MSQKDHNYKLEVEGISGAVIDGKTEFAIEAGGVLNIPLRVSAPGESLTTRSSDITFKIVTQDAQQNTHLEKAKFLGPKK